MIGSLERTIEVLGQIAVSQKGVDPIQDGHGVGDILTDFQRSATLHQFYKELFRESLKIKSAEETYNLKASFAGALFNNIAFLSLSHSQDTNHLLLSPDNTLEFYRHLFPNTEIASNLFEMDSLKGVSVPDGLILEQIRGQHFISRVCEYSLMDSYNYSNNKVDCFLYIRSRMPNLFGNTKLILVTPQNHKSKLQSTDLEYVELPFGYQRFGEFVNSTIDSFAPVRDSATIADIQKRMISQQARQANLQNPDYLNLITNLAARFI